MRKDTGFSLIEMLTVLAMMKALIAFAIFSVGILAVGAMQINSANTNSGAGNINDAKTGNSDSGNRQVYTAEYNDFSGDWSKTRFDAANVDALLTQLAVDPHNGDTAA